MFVFEPIGSLMSGWITEPIGRKRAMFFVNIPHLVAWTMFYYSTTLGEMWIAFALLGFGIGLMESPIVTYVGEIRYLWPWDETEKKKFNFNLNSTQPSIDSRHFDWHIWCCGLNRCVHHISVGEHFGLAGRRFLLFIHSTIDNDAHLLYTGDTDVVDVEKSNGRCTKVIAMAPWLGVTGGCCKRIRRNSTIHGILQIMCRLFEVRSKMSTSTAIVRSGLTRIAA